jgi:hypothetical protein
VRVPLAGRSSFHEVIATVGEVAHVAAETGWPARRPDPWVQAVTSTYDWRAEFINAEANELHAEAFGTRMFGDAPLR